MGASQHKGGFGPSFLCIGASRAGTTWLYMCLRDHPQIWLPPVKELHFLDGQLGQPMFNRHCMTHLTKRFKSYMLSLRSLAPPPDLWRTFIWDLNYFLRPRRTLSLYRSLFRPRPGQVAGELTPAYSLLESEKIELLANLNPKLKIIYLMRNPIERDWSDLALRAMRADCSIINLSNRLWVLRRYPMGFYVDVMDKWLRFFPENQFFFGFTDELSHDPEGLLCRLFAFLGVDADRKYVSARARERVNSASSHKMEMPPRMALMLARKHYEKLKELERRFGGYTTQWLAQAEAIIKKYDKAFACNKNLKRVA